jgi:hypothetical protein
VHGRYAAGVVRAGIGTYAAPKTFHEILLIYGSAGYRDPHLMVAPRCLDNQESDLLKTLHLLRAEIVKLANQHRTYRSRT